MPGLQLLPFLSYYGETNLLSLSWWANLTIEDIKKIFQDMFKQHQEAITKKQEKIFRSHENSIMQLTQTQHKRKRNTNN